MRRIGAELIDRMSDEFEPDKYRDEYRIRVLALLDAAEIPRSSYSIERKNLLLGSIPESLTSRNTPTSPCGCLFSSPLIQLQAGDQLCMS